MCDPVTIATVATIGSGVIGAFSAIQQGQAQKKAANYQAQVDAQNATLAQQQKATIEEQASIDNRRLGQQKAAAIGDLRAKAGASGLDIGTDTSASDLIGDTSAAYRIDQNILFKNAKNAMRDKDIESYNYNTDAILQQQKGKDAANAGFLGAAGSLLSSAGSVASKWTPKASSHPEYA